MKKEVFYLSLALVGILASCNNSGTTNENQIAVNDSSVVPPPPPYTIQLEEIVVPELPDLHSYTHAIYGDKIVMFGGRTSGLHTFNYVFQTTRSNTNIYVIDTKQWSDPAKWNVYSMPDKNITFSGKQPIPTDNNRFHANNAQFFTRDSVLYLIGGLLSVDNPGPTANPSTLPYITAIDLPALIKSVMAGGTPMKPNSIRQALIKDKTFFSITGGEVSVMDNTVYLVFGWNYWGSGDYYSHQIKKFTFSDNGFGLTIKPATSWSDGYPNAVDSINDGAYRRRDGSMSAMIDPADGSNMLLYYGGVFKQGYTYFSSPVWINKDTAMEKNFTMRSNIYTCQVIPVYSKSRSESYATLMGGIKNAVYTGPALNNKPALLTEENASLLDTNGRFSNFSFAPFTNQFSTICINKEHSFAQYLLPDSFPTTKIAITLPASANYKNDSTISPGAVMYNGSESEMLWNLNQKYVMTNGVVNYDALIKDSINGANIGYLHGGILSSLPNVLVKSSFHFSVASNRLFKVKIVPLTK